jgi:hypothetical protein
VVIPELVEARWYYRLLHDQTATFIRTLLLLRGGPQLVLITMPWYLRDWKPERHRLVQVRKALQRGADRLSKRMSVPPRRGRTTR